MRFEKHPNARCHFEWMDDVACRWKAEPDMEPIYEYDCRLYSYVTLVAEKIGRYVIIYDYYSPTTSKHIGWWLDEMQVSRKAMKHIGKVWDCGFNKALDECPMVRADGSPLFQK